ncbi:MAG TPA: sigma-70 family RNA polymerase sigma factor [Candidatus Limnocylindrales bacterium]|nr:sigma-70 family RNA polymerase sigma factor [Candidatus Limnocylindrales bacterium]
METELVGRARSGDTAAFDALVRTRLERVHRMSLAILGNEADAADATQDAFIAAWRRLPALRDPDRFDAWLWRIVSNTCRERLRGRRRASVREVRVRAEDDPPGATAEPPSEAVVAADRFDRAFATLSAEQRVLLVAHHLEELPVGEIATRLGVPAGTVKSRLFHARQALDRALAVEDDR